MKTRFELLVACLALALFAVACGGTGGESVIASDQVEAIDPAASADSDDASGDGDGSSGDSDGDSDDEANDADDDDESSDGEPETLEDLLGGAVRFVRRGGGGGGGQFNADPDQLIDQQRQIEEATRTCMLNQGFEYTMEDVTGTGQAFGRLANQGAELTPEEYAAEEGFGLSTRFDALLNGGLAALGITEAEEDPNDALLESMSEAEADAWEIALNGTPPERDAEGRPIDPETGEVIEGGRGRGAGRGGLNQGGCRSESNEAVRGDFSALAELSDEFAELDARIDADPRIVEIGNDWQECMNDAGYFYSDVDEAREEIRTEFRPVVVAALGFGPGGRGRNNAEAGASGLDAEGEALLLEVQEKERAIAVANYNCSAETADEVAEIQARYESEFIDANRAMLESVGN